VPSSDTRAGLRSRRRLWGALGIAQAIIRRPLLRAKESMTVDDIMAIGPQIGLVDFKQTYPALADRLNAVPGLRDFAEIEVATFSKQTSPRV
jgi:hypothetical protein